MEEYAEKVNFMSRVNTLKYRRRFEKVKSISGPITFYFFPLVDGKAFYLFGDEHTSGGGCEIKNIDTTDEIGLVVDSYKALLEGRRIDSSEEVEMRENKRKRRAKLIPFDEEEEEKKKKNIKKC